MSLIQKEIADFSVQCYQNNAFHAVTKADVLGKWSVFFFYPADFTFVCPTELEDLANKYAEFQAAGCEIYAVSCDTHFVHKAWHDASERIQKIQYPMLADPTHCLAKDFEVYIEADGVAERGSFIVNPEGKIVAYEVNAGNVGRNADELLRKVQACQFVAEHGDEVCPAKWQPGAGDPEAQFGPGGTALRYGPDGKLLRCRGHRRWSSGTHRRPLPGPGPLPGGGRGEGSLRRADHHYLGSGELSRRGQDQRDGAYRDHAEAGGGLRR